VQVVMARFEEQLATRKLVDRAKGVLTERQGLSERDAYQRIQRQERRSMRQVAEAILRQARD
jgi:AmiR/NasT family two-component response regulator